MKAQLELLGIMHDSLGVLEIWALGLRICCRTGLYLMAVTCPKISHASPQHLVKQIETPESMFGAISTV